MAVEIVGGQAVFKYDLGAGPARITNPVNVADGEWHELIIERSVSHQVWLQLRAIKDQPPSVLSSLLFVSDKKDCLLPTKAKW